MPFVARAAVALTYGLSLAMRWVPSEINVADKRGRASELGTSARSPCPRTGRTIPLLDVNGMSQWNPPCAWRVSALARCGATTDCSPGTKVSRNRASLRHRSVFIVPGRTDFELMSVGPNDPKRPRAVAAPASSRPGQHAEGSPTPLSDITNIASARHSNNPRLGERRGRVGRHGRRLPSTQLSGKEVTRAWELGWPRHWRGPCHSVHDGGQMKLLRVRQASVDRWTSAAETVHGCRWPSPP